MLPPAPVGSVASLHLIAAIQAARKRSGGLPLARILHGIPIALALLAPGPAPAIERPIAGDSLSLSDPPERPQKRSVRFVAVGDPGLGAALAADPRQVGATLEIRGLGENDGASGEIFLAPELWSGLGRPAGSRGWRFSDRGRQSGIRSVQLQPARGGGSLAVSGGGAAWLYELAQPQQGPIELRLRVGEDLVCARFERLDRNEIGRLSARRAAAPERCTPTVCGDAVAEGREECDDGNASSGDGCSSLCRLENESALCAGVPAAAGTSLRARRIASGLEAPVHLAAPRLDPQRLFVVEKAGRIRILERGVLVAKPFLSLEGRVSTAGERGLLSMAFHPDYAVNGRFFVYYTDHAGDIVISEFEASANADRANPASERVLLVVDHPTATNHNGGQLAFEPGTTLLYAATGDGGSTPGAARDPSNLLGKLLRLDVDAPMSPPPVAVLAQGLRNPFRFAFDRVSRDLYLTDVGQSAWEEVNHDAAPVDASRDYGWNLFEASICTTASCPDPADLDFPVLEYCNLRNPSDPDCAAHPPGCSVIGGFVYRGCALPALHGRYFYSDYCNPFLRSFTIGAGGVAQELEDHDGAFAQAQGGAITRVVSFGEDARGELYVVDQADGEVYRLEPDPD